MSRWCALGVIILSTPALAAPPLEVRQETSAIGDGRTLVELTLRGGPARARFEPADHPVLPHLRCDGAAAYPAGPNGAPVVLGPAVAEVRTVSCVVEQRGATATFEVQLRPPGPGLYAELRPTHAATGDPPIVGSAFVVDADGTRQRTAALQVAASTGTVEVDGDRFTIVLPQEKAPKVVTIALVDGEQIGAVFLPVRGRVELPVSTMSGAEVRVRVAGEWFGPVRAKRGTVTVPLEVPPGVREAVVRAADPVGNVGETVVDLNTPDRPRLTVVAPGREVSAGSSMMLAVAYAQPDGRPGALGAHIVVEAERGQVGVPEFRGGGLWAVPYTALADVGDDQLVVRVDGDAAAGEARLAILFVPGRPARVEVRVPAEPYAAGAEVEVEVRVLDWIGLPLADATASLSLSGQPVTLERIGGKLRGRLLMPDKVPESGDLHLAVEVDEGVRLERTLRVAPGTVSSAQVDVESRGRSAVVRVVAFDRFGNRVARTGFDVEAEGGNASKGRETEAGWETELVANEDAWEGALRILGETGALAEAVVEFSPPTRVFRLGAVATVGGVTNGHGVYSPRGGLAAALRRGFGSFELALSLGFDVSAYSAESSFRLDGDTHSVSRSVTTMGVPVRFSGRRWLSSRFGLAAGVSVVPMYARVSVTPDFQAAQVGEDWVVAVRGDLRVFFSVGPGEVFAELAVSGAQLEHELANGTLERFAASLGYAFWVPGLAF